MRYVFGDYLLDTQRYELSYRNQPIKLRPKVFHVLRYLIAIGIASCQKTSCSNRCGPINSLATGA